MDWYLQQFEFLLLLHLQDTFQYESYLPNVIIMQIIDIAPLPGAGTVGVVARTLSVYLFAHDSYAGQCSWLNVVR